MIYLKGSLLGLFMFCYAAMFIPSERWQTFTEKTPTINVEDLIDASKLGDLERMSVLLAHGADVNAADQLGVTPLIAASSSLQRSAIELLLAHGANRSAKTNEGFTAYDFAKNQLDDNLASILASKETVR